MGRQSNVLDVVVKRIGEIATVPRQMQIPSLLSYLIAFSSRKIDANVNDKTVHSNTKDEKRYGHG